jgi:hypothetical protein
VFPAWKDSEGFEHGDQYRTYLFVCWSAVRGFPEPPIFWYLLPRLEFNISVFLIFCVGVTPPSDPTTGIIVIAVVCCVLGTSLVWVFIIYHTRWGTEFWKRTVISFYGSGSDF